MNQVTLGRKTGLDRHSFVAWMKAAIDHAEALPREKLTHRVLAPAGLPMEVIVDDAALAQRYFPRLAAGSQPTSLARNRIYVLSSDISGLSAPDWQDTDCTAKAFQAAASKDDFRASYPLIPRIWQFFDTKRRIGIQLTQSSHRLPRWDAAAPLRLHLHWLLAECGARLTHGASLGLEHRGILILGKGGTGKSATTLAGLAAGLSTTGDDYVALDRRTPSVYPLYRIMKQDRDGLERLPNLCGKLAGHPANWQGKIEFDPEDVFPHTIVDRLDLTAILLPRIAHAARPSIEAVAPATAMLALMSTNLHQHIGEQEMGMAFFGDLLRRLPCFRIDLAHDAMANGAAIREFLQASAL